MYDAIIYEAIYGRRFLTPGIYDDTCYVKSKKTVLLLMKKNLYIYKHNCKLLMLFKRVLNDFIVRAIIPIKQNTNI